MIITQHDNAAWVRRNLRLILNDDVLFNRVKIIPLGLQSSKVNAMNEVKRQKPTITQFILVDDSDTETEAGVSANKATVQGDPTRKLYDFEIKTIQATEGSNQYLRDLARLIRLPRISIGDNMMVDLENQDNSETSKLIS